MSPGAYVLGVGLVILASGCGNGSSSDQSQFTLSLESDAPCYGVRAEIDLAALSKANGACAASEEVTAAGCTTEISTQGDLLVADARGCMIDPGTALFDCELASGNAAVVEAATTLSYGCGCQATCPTDVSVQVQAAAGAGITGIAWGFDTGSRPLRVATAVASTTSTSLSLTCDYFENVTVSMDAATRVTEIAFLLSLDGLGEQCEFSADECRIAVATNGPSYIRAVERTLEVCISDVEGIEVDAVLIGCELIAPDYGNPPLTLLRAEGEQLEPLDPAPTLTLKSTL